MSMHSVYPSKLSDGSFLNKIRLDFTDSLHFLFHRYMLNSNDTLDIPIPHESWRGAWIPNLGMWDQCGECSSSAGGGGTGNDNRQR